MKNKKRSQFAKKATGVSSPLTPLRHTSNISASSKWYRDCRLELDRFIGVHYDRDYSRLIIEGEVPEEVLKEAWLIIYSQYCEMMNDGAYNELLDKTKKMQELNGRISLLDGIVQHLQMKHDRALIEIVNKMAIPLILEVDEDPAKKLKMVQGRVKRMIFDLGKLEKEVEDLQKIKQAETGLEYFDDWLSIMSKQYGYAVRAKDITVAQFVRNMKRLNEQFLKQQAHGT